MEKISISGSPWKHGNENSNKDLLILADINADYRASMIKYYKYGLRLPIGVEYHK